MDISRTRSRAWSRNPLTALLLVAALLAGAFGINAVASASTDFTSPEPTSGEGGIPLIRNDSLPISITRGAYYFSRTPTGSNPNPNYQRVSPTAIGLSSAACKGDNPAGKNLTPYTKVSVKHDDTGAEIYTWLSPVMDISIGGALSGFPVLATQPAPNDTNFRGDYVGSSTSNVEPSRGWASGTGHPKFVPPVSLSGKPSGTYTITTTHVNMLRTGASGAAGNCQIATPGITGTTFNNTFTTGPQTEVDHFEYRPWQEQFNDVLGNGQVQFNTVPAESAFSFASPAVQSTIQSGGMTFFSLPELETFTLPEDPAACAANPAACLPTIATACDPSAGCTPRLVLIQRTTAATPTSPATKLDGVFDLDTRAFVAQASIGASTRYLFSLGTQLDAVYGDVLDQLAAQAAAQGVDLGTLLRTVVRVRLGGNEIKLSLLKGLQIDPTTAVDGVQIVSDLSVQAGLIFYLGGGSSSAVDPDGPLGPLGLTCGASFTGGISGADLTYDPAPGIPGLRVSKLPVTLPTTSIPITLPAIPGVPTSALGLTSALGGQVWHIDSVNGAVGTALTALGATTQPDAPSGLPAWISLVDPPAPAAAATKYEFIGTPLLFVNQNIGPILGSCTTVSTFLGAGIGIANNPLPLKLADLIRLTHGLNPVLAPLLGPVVAAVADLTGQVLTNPTIVDLLTQVNGAIGGGG